jgi:hypothetical protein
MSACSTHRTSGLSRLRGQPATWRRGNGRPAVARRSPPPTLRRAGVSPRRRSPCHRIAHCQHADDVVAHGTRGGGGETQRLRPAEPVERLAEGGVCRSEVVSPRADAVRLVDHDQRRWRCGDRRHRLVVLELLERADLIVLERDQRRDHQRRPGDLGAAHLVDRRLAAAGQSPGVDRAVPAQELSGLFGRQAVDEVGDLAGGIAGFHRRAGTAHRRAQISRM